jgi:hypothetical protein
VSAVTGNCIQMLESVRRSIAWWIAGDISAEAEEKP